MSNIKLKMWDKRFDDLIRSEEFLNLVGPWTGIPNLLYDPEYVGGGTHENRHGQELDPHVDFNYHPTTALHRRLNLILFLNREWDESWGGVLDFHRDPWDPDSDQVRSIPPAFNRCVVFETNEYSWHGFRQIALPEDKRHISRHTIAVYFYTRERPPDEVAPDHSTVYVPRPMPAHFQPGHTLSEDDYSDLRTLYMRNTHQIKFLYDLLAKRSHVLAERDSQVETLSTEIAWRRQEIARLKQQSDKQEEEIALLKQQSDKQEEEIALHKKVLGEVEASPSFRIGRLMTWPLRALRGLGRGS